MTIADIKQLLKAQHTTAHYGLLAIEALEQEVERLRRAAAEKPATTDVQPQKEK